MVMAMVMEVIMVTGKVAVIKVKVVEVLFKMERWQDAAER